MNVIVLTIDTLRYDHLGANGNDEIRTPNLDRLADRSWNFSRAFAASFPTVPNRTDAMTGRYGGPFHPWGPLDCGRKTLPEALAESGYVTQLLHDTPHLVNGGHRFDYPFHAWSFVRGGEVDRGWVTDSWELLDNWEFDSLFDDLPLERDPASVLTRGAVMPRYVQTNRGRTDPEDWSVARLFRRSAEFLEANASRDDFFLWIDCFDPHEPWDVPPEYVELYDSGTGTIDPRSLHYDMQDHPNLPAAAKRRIAATYRANVTFVDRWLGELLDALDDTGLWENTAVLVAGDHGTNLNEDGRGFGKRAPPAENEAHVPLFLYVPDGGSGRCDELVQPQDFFATICGLAGAETPADVDSRDLVALAEGDSVADRREIALAGTDVSAWEGAESEDVLFSAFDGEWCLGVAPDPAASPLRRLGDSEDRSESNPAVVERLHDAAVSEVIRRGLDSGVADWLTDRGTGEFPQEFQVTDAPRPPDWWEPYWTATDFP